VSFIQRVSLREKVVPGVDRFRFAILRCCRSVETAA
jgi:hypothetical protein